MERVEQKNLFQILILQLNLEIKQFKKQTKNKHLKIRKYKMKKIGILIAVILLVGCAASVNLPLSQQNTIKVIEAKGQTKVELFRKTNEWFAETYKDYSKVVKMKSLKSGKFTARAVSSADIGMGMRSDFYYDIHIDLKDGKARIKTFEYIYTQGGPRIQILAQFNDAQLQMKKIVNSYENKLIGKKENW